MKRKKITLVAVFVILLGAGLLAYPLVSNLLYQQKQNELEEYYDNLVYELPEKEVAQMWEDCNVYNQSLLDIMVKLTDPFSEEKLDMDIHPYIDLLNVSGDGAMGSIDIPSIDCHLIIYHNTDADVLAKGIGHLQGSSLPVGGTGTHAVLTGHTGAAGKALFTNLDQVEMGDVFYIHVLGDTLAYQVDQIKVVLPKDTSDLAIDREQDYVTLVTCTPYGINSHRLLVRGTRIPYEDAVENENEGSRGSTWQKQYIMAIIVGILLSILMIVVIQLVRRAKRRKADEKDS